jgi:hypothetical protein
MVVSMGCFSGCCGVVLADYPRGGSSWSIPLSDFVRCWTWSPESGPKRMFARCIRARTGSRSLIRMHSGHSQSRPWPFEAFGSEITRRVRTSSRLQSLPSRPCQVQVSFFGADGSLIGNATTVQLKAGESTSVPASQPSKLVRAVVSVGDVVDPAKLCALKTRVEIFDVQTGTTFVSVSGDSIGATADAVHQWAQALRAAHQKPRSPELVTTPIKCAHC